MDVAEKFERLLDTNRRPDGHQWTGQRLEEATGGVVPRSYFVNLRKGRIESPGYEKMAAIAKAMGFPPEAWFDVIPGGVTPATSGGELDVAAGLSTYSTPSRTRLRESPSRTRRLPA
jgi:hypothetical protein